jgi:hypothetical protein
MTCVTRKGRPFEGDPDTPMEFPSNEPDDSHTHGKLRIPISSWCARHWILGVLAVDLSPSEPLESSEQQTDRPAREFTGGGDGH